MIILNILKLSLKHNATSYTLSSQLAYLDNYLGFLHVKPIS